MANPKYAELPGIASDQPDVYETDDLPEADQLSSEIFVDQSDSVEPLSVSANEAYNRFKGHTLDASSADFTERIGYGRKKGYTVISGDYEMAGDNENETPQQKYQRLKFEVKEFMEELSKIKETVVEDGKEMQLSDVLTPQMQEVQKQLVDLNLEQALGSDILNSLSDPQGATQKRLVSHLESFKEGAAKRDAKLTTKAPAKSSTAEGVTYELFYKPEHSKLQETAKLAVLEERIKKLEALVGTDNQKVSALTAHTNGKSLMDATHVLSAKLSLLESSNLEQIESRLLVLQQRMQQVAEKKKQTEDADKQSKINELYELLQKSEVMSVSLGKVMERLISIQDLHEQALQFSKTLSQLDAVQQHISGSLKNDEQLLKEVQQNFVKNTEVIKNNIASLEARLATLKK